MNISSPYFLEGDAFIEKLEKDNETYQNINDSFNESNKHLFTKIEKKEMNKLGKMVHKLYGREMTNNK